MREWIVKLALVAFGFFIVVAFMAALEFGLSKFAPHPRTFYEQDEYIGWKGVPGKEKRYADGRIASYLTRRAILNGGEVVSRVKINSHGFRDKERTYEKAENTFRILVLGDSFTEAIQVPLEETFPYILEEKLNSGGGGGSTISPSLNPQRFEVLNLGITGFGTAQEYLTFEHYGLKYHPNFVILAFFIGNDVVDNSLTLGPDSDKPYFVLNGGNLEEIPFKINVGRPLGVTGQFQTLKYFFAEFFPNISNLLNARIKETSWLEDFLWKIGIVKSKPQYEKNGIPIYDYVYAEKYTPEWQGAWDITKAIILKWAKELETDKIGFLVVVIPNEFEFRPDIWDKILNENPQMKTIKLDLRKPEHILSNFLEANKIDYLLLRPEFERYSKETGKDLHFHYVYENHWNADGHALVAQLIYKKLKDDKLIPMWTSNQ